MPSDDAREDQAGTVPEAPEAAPEAAPLSDPLPDYEAAIDRWFADTMPGSPLARSTEAYNHVYAALKDLKTRLKGAR